MQEKAKKSKAKAIAARDLRDSQDPKAAFSVIRAREAPEMHIMAPLLDQGIAFFMSHYSVGIDQPPVSSEAYHKHLSTDGFHPLVATSMTALGVAGIANLYMDSRLKREAMRWYLNAIKMANAAISSPKEVKSDTTLVAVNLLGMFEATFNDQSLDGWSNHVDGAASLVKMRGIDQFSTPAGQRMYLHTIGLLTMNCMGKGIALPDYVSEMNNEVMNYLDVKDPRYAFFFLHVKTIDLRARILKEKDQNLAEIVDCALELDDIAKNIFQDVGTDWSYEEVPNECQPGVFADFYHIYPTHATAQTWNWVRYNRIYFHDIIRNCILAGFTTVPPTLVGSRYHDQLAESTRLLYKIQSDIIASMPQFLQDVPMYPPPRLDPQSPRPEDTSTVLTGPSPSDTPTTPSFSRSTTPSSFRGPPTPQAPNGTKVFHHNFRGDSVPVVNHLLSNGAVQDRIPIVRISGGYSTVWALYVAGSMPLATPRSQDYVYTCLARIEREFGINQARVLGNALQIKRTLDGYGATAFGICPQYLPHIEGPYVPFQGMGTKVGYAGPELLMDAGFQAGLPSPGTAQPTY